MKYTVTFGKPRLASTFGDYTEYIFPYSVVESRYIGEADEEARTSGYVLTVRVSGSLCNGYWKFEEPDLRKVLFEFARRHIKSAIEDRKSLANLRLNLDSGTENITPCPFDPTRIPEPMGFQFEVNSGEQVEHSDAVYFHINTQGGAFIVGDVFAATFISRDQVSIEQLTQDVQLTDKQEQVLKFIVVKHAQQGFHRINAEEISNARLTLSDNEIEEALSFLIVQQLLTGDRLHMFSLKYESVMLNPLAWCEWGTKFLGDHVQQSIDSVAVHIKEKTKGPAIADALGLTPAFVDMAVQHLKAQEKVEITCEHPVPSGFSFHTVCRIRCRGS